MLRYESLIRRQLEEHYPTIYPEKSTEFHLELYRSSLLTGCDQNKLKQSQSDRTFDCFTGCNRIEGTPELSFCFMPAPLPPMRCDLSHTSPDKCVLRAHTESRDTINLFAGYEARRIAGGNEFGGAVSLGFS